MANIWMCVWAGERMIDVKTLGNLMCWKHGIFTDFMPFLSHCSLLPTVLLVFAPTEKGNPHIVWIDLMVRQGLQWEAPPWAPLIQSVVKPTVSGWEACPQLGLRGHWRACSPFEGSIFTHGLAILERNRRARVCLTAWHARHGETSLHLPPLTWASELGFVHGSPVALQWCWPGGLRLVLRESFSMSVFVCVHMCFWMLNMRALCPRQSIRQNTTISMENCISSLKFPSWFTKPMWEFIDSSHLKFGLRS